MVDAPWQILVVDDEKIVCDQIKRQFENETLDQTERTVQVTAIQDFATAYEHLETKKIDAIVLDVKDENGKNAGVETLSEIRARRFVPVVFYTGNQNQVAHLQSDVVRIVEKTEGLEAIHKALSDIVATGIPTANRAIVRHVEEVQRDFMWDSHMILTNYQGSADRLSIAFLMARRLAASLARTGIEQLAKDMGDTEDLKVDGDHVHPMFFYIIPPIIDLINTGCLYLESSTNAEGAKLEKYWIVLTNSCDLKKQLVVDKFVAPHKIKCLPRKAERILLAGCAFLSQQKEHAAWQKKPSDASIRELMRNNRKDAQSERYHFLPAAVDFPDLIADFQDLKSVTAEEVGQMNCKAMIDSPFVESIIARFTRYFSRIGTPDLDSEIVLSRTSKK